MPKKNSRAPKAIAVTPALVRKWKLASVAAKSDKEEKGRVLVIAGSKELSGAAMLAGLGALRAGAGKLQIVTENSVADIVAGEVPEALVAGVPASQFKKPIATRSRIKRLIEECDALLMGPGLVGGRGLGIFVRSVLRAAEKLDSPPTIILDAGALESFHPIASWVRPEKIRVIITPHAGEMASVTGLSRRTIESAPARHALEFSRRMNVTVVLKGAETFIASPEPRLYKNTRGNAGLATCGSGDVLAGVIGALAARNEIAVQASAGAVLFHSLSGERLAKEIGPFGYLAREIASEIARVVSR